MKSGNLPCQASSSLGGSGVNRSNYHHQTPESFEELEYFRSLPAVGMTDSALQWWSGRRLQFPTLSILAAQFLGISATSWDAHRFAEAAGASFACLQNEMSPPDLESFITLHENWDDNLCSMSPPRGGVVNPTYWPGQRERAAAGNSSMSVSSQGSNSFAYSSRGAEWETVV